MITVTTHDLKNVKYDNSLTVKCDKCGIIKAKAIIPSKCHICLICLQQIIDGCEENLLKETLAMFMDNQLFAKRMGDSHCLPL